MSCSRLLKAVNDDDDDDELHVSLSSSSYFLLYHKNKIKVLEVTAVRNLGYYRNGCCGFLLKQL